jgi:hypothetical protein
MEIHQEIRLDRGEQRPDANVSVWWRWMINWASIISNAVPFINHEGD